MECKPFNINVILVVAGGIRTNFASSSLSDFTMPEESFYKAYVKQIIERINMSHAPNSLSAQDFALVVVNGTLKAKPPFTIKTGGNTLLYKIFAWLPRTWVLNALWRALSKAPKETK